MNLLEEPGQQMREWRQCSTVGCWRPARHAVPGVRSTVHMCKLCYEAYQQRLREREEGQPSVK